VIIDLVLNAPEELRVVIKFRKTNWYRLQRLGRGAAHGMSGSQRDMKMVSRRAIETGARKFVGHSNF